VKSGRTNDEVRAAPAVSWTGSANWAGPTADELAALDELGASGRWALGDHEVRLSGLDDVLFPGHGGSARTRRDLVRHHAVMAPALLPYLAGRPVEAHRFPHGIDGKGSWQRTAPARAPDWIERWRDRLVPDSAAALAWLGAQAAVELAPWAATVDQPERPTWAQFVITGDRADVLAVARLHRTALEHLGVEGRPVADGLGGLAIWVPVSGATAEAVTAWVAAVAEAVTATLPDVDVTAGPPDGLLAAPWSPRPAPGAPVAVPLAWDELDDDDLRLDAWTVADAPDRLAGAGDPLAPLVGRAQRLPRL
jgi:bifunctional non-homologous end joining protein LigD